MAVEFYSWDGQRETEYVGRVEDGGIVDGADKLESILLDDDLATLAENGEPLSDEDYLVRRYSGPKFIAKEVADG